MSESSYPSDAFVTVAMEHPHQGQIVIQGATGHRVLWECEHEHPTGEEAAACAGEEIGRTGRT